MMNRLARVFFALLVFLSATTFAPPAQALPTYSTMKEFWHCDYTPLGWRFWSCGGSLFGSGASSGFWMRVTETECDESQEQRVQWYRCQSGSCTEISEPSGPPWC